MILQLERRRRFEEIDRSTQRQRVKLELRRIIRQALQAAKDLSAEDCLSEIRARLLAIQSYCESLDKTFITVEERITCDRYDLGGSPQHPAILFRGSSEDASVAICVTHRGSLLHRSDSAWTIYRNRGDVCPVEPIL